VVKSEPNVVVKSEPVQEDNTFKYLYGDSDEEKLMPIAKEKQRKITVVDISSDSDGENAVKKVSMALKCEHRTYRRCR
jgi:hypothetical protein